MKECDLVYDLTALAPNATSADVMTSIELLNRQLNPEFNNVPMIKFIIHNVSTFII